MEMDGQETEALKLLGFTPEERDQLTMLDNRLARLGAGLAADSCPEFLHVAEWLPGSGDGCDAPGCPAQAVIRWHQQGWPAGRCLEYCGHHAKTLIPQKELLRCQGERTAWRAVMADRRGHTPKGTSHG